MVVIRPVTLDDLDAIEALATLTGFGLTTLPRDVKLLRQRIRRSLRGFEKLTDEDAPRGETYLFVMEDLPSGRVVGTCGIVSKVGGFEPFYGYRLETAVHESKSLNVRKEICTLHLDEDHDGPCEIGSLFLAPEFRRDGNGRLLSLSRFLFMASFHEYFDPLIIAELRGVVDDRGYSPFWEAVGRHFFDVDFPTADFLSMVDKRFIADLMPSYPLYIPLLPLTAQEVIGKVHADAAPALKLLQGEGFRTTGTVDIFDAGPVVRCPLDQIRTVRESVEAVVTGISDAEATGQPMHVGNTRREFRACLAPLRITPGGVGLSAPVASALKVAPGDFVRYAMPHPVVPPTAPMSQDEECGSASTY